MFIARRQLQNHDHVGAESRESFLLPNSTTLSPYVSIMPVDILNNQTLANTPTVGNQDVIPAMPIIPTPNGDPGVPVVPVIKRRKAKRTKAQKDSAKENASVMWNAIDKRREEYRGQINELAKEFNR